MGAICPNCESENVYYDRGEYVCMDCDFVWFEGTYPEYECSEMEDEDDTYSD